MEGLSDLPRRPVICLKTMRRSTRALVNRPAGKRLQGQQGRRPETEPEIVSALSVFAQFSQGKH